MGVIESCTKSRDLGNSVLTLIISLTHFSIFLFSPTETSASQDTLPSHSSRYITLPMTWIGEIKPNGLYIKAT